MNADVEVELEARLEILVYWYPRMSAKAPESQPPRAPLSAGKRGEIARVLKHRGREHGRRRQRKRLTCLRHEFHDRAAESLRGGRHRLLRRDNRVDDLRPGLLPELDRLLDATRLLVDRRRDFE